MRASPYEPIHALLIGELNRLHRLELLMESWAAATKNRRLQRSLDACCYEVAEGEVINTDYQYAHGNIGEEEALDDVIHVMTRRGPTWFWEHRSILNREDLIPDSWPTSTVLQKLCAKKLCNNE